MIADVINGALVRLYTAVKTAKREDGQTFVEYSLIGVLVAVILAAALVTFRGQIEAALTSIGNTLNPPKS